MPHPPNSLPAHPRSPKANNPRHRPKNSAAQQPEIPAVYGRTQQNNKRGRVHPADHRNKLRETRELLKCDPESEEIPYWHRGSPKGIDKIQSVHPPEGKKLPQPHFFQQVRNIQIYQFHCRAAESGPAPNPINQGAVKTGGTRETNAATFR